MKTLYLDCGSGAAGDMMSAALWELTENKEEVLTEINSIGIPGVKTYALPSQKQGIFGTHFRVTFRDVEEESEVLPSDYVVDTFLVEDHDHEHEQHHEHEEHRGHEHHHKNGLEDEHLHGYGHHHTSLATVEEIISYLNVSNKVKTDAKAIYHLLADAESTVHGTTVSEIHFHEVGNMDAIADIVTVCLLMEKLAPEQVIASSVHTGSGKVKCAHGILPIPAPATSVLLQGIPIYSAGVNGELCTPTGAALLKYFVDSFGPMPVMNIEDIGYGVGTKDYAVANCFRAFLGETDETLSAVSNAPVARASAPHEQPVASTEKQLKAISNRIARSIGHLESVKRMVDNNRDASDILIQLSAVESSLASTARVIMKEQMKTSMETAADKGDASSLEELYGLIDKFIK